MGKNVIESVTSTGPYITLGNSGPNENSKVQKEEKETQIFITNEL